jgi:hypothetical protein
MVPNFFCKIIIGIFNLIFLEFVKKKNLFDFYDHHSTPYQY